jgi:heme/copper-type cytochrome/quinol oxidase subunit 2
MTFAKLFKTIPFVLAGGVAALAIGACGSGGQASSDNPVPVAAQLLSYQIVGPDAAPVPGPDGNKHDIFSALGSTTVKVGVPVTITITDKDDVPHSMTSSDLGLNIVVPARTDKGDGVATFTFTPTKIGTFRWFCAIPCDTDNAGWDMTSDGSGSGQLNFMAGNITVTA